MNAPEFAAVIAGGDLSGLSLAAHLATRGWRDRSVLVVDDPDRRTPAARWGFRSAGPGLLDAAVSHTYDQARIQPAESPGWYPPGSIRAFAGPDPEPKGRGTADKGRPALAGRAIGL